MKRFTLQRDYILIFMFVGIFFAGSVLAEKPSWKNDDKGGKNKSKKTEESFGEKGNSGHNQSYESNRSGDQRHRHFNEQQRSYIHDYYANAYRKGHCPPGLAKKGNGCMPPGQAKKWGIGRPLPKEVIYHDLPSSLLVQLGPVPSRHKFVRVAQDILLIAVGTGMVVDAIDDLSWEFDH